MAQVVAGPVVLAEVVPGVLAALLAQQALPTRAVAAAGVNVPAFVLVAAAL